MTWYKKIDTITLAAPAIDNPAEYLDIFAETIKTTGKAKTEVNKIPVKKKPNSTAGPDFSVEKSPSEAQLAAIIIGKGDNNMNGTKATQEKENHNKN